MNTGYIRGIIQETITTRRFIITNPQLEKFDFTAGQLVQLGLEINGRISWRNYSISSWPDGTNTFELLITYQKDGLFSEYLFNEIKIGDVVYYSGPYGAFVLPQIIDKTLIFISTGSGVSPFRSMINYIVENDVETRDIHLLFGCRTKRDILYYDEMKKLQQQYPKFKFKPVLSREEWEGLNGYVQHHISNVIHSLHDKPLVYLCGWSDMLWDARAILKEMGFELGKDIKVENFG